MNPASPSLSPDELTLLRIACCVAWSDGSFAPEERRMLARVVKRYFSPEASPPDTDAVETLAAEALPLASLDGLVALLTSEEDRRLALKLAYQMVRAGRSAGDTSSINAAEKVAYRRLVGLLGLEEDAIRETEWAAEQELAPEGGLWDLLRRRFTGLGAWPSDAMLDAPGAPHL